MLETALTFEGVNVVIDSGIRCVVYGSRHVVEYCDQVSMIQRAGRTGRTCDGVVYRLMTQNLFYDQPFQLYSEHNFDLIVLQLFVLNASPTHLLGQEASDSISSFKELGLMKEESKPPCPMLSRFITSSSLEVRTAMMLHRYSNLKNRNMYQDILMFFALSIINIFTIKPGNVVYFGENKHRCRILFLIHRDFEIEYDPLITLMNIVLSVFLSNNPKEFAAEYSLNFKLLREIMTQFRRLFKFMYPNLISSDIVDLHGFKEGSWQHFIYPYLVTFYKKDDHRIECVQIPKKTIARIRFLLLTDPVNSITIGNPVMIDEFIPFYSNVIVKDTTKKFLVKLSDNDDPKIWTLPLFDYRENKHKHILVDHIEKCIAERDYKNAQKNLFTNCIHEIENEVAFRPGNYKMLEAQARFLSFASMN